MGRRLNCGKRGEDDLKGFVRARRATAREEDVLVRGGCREGTDGVIDGGMAETSVMFEFGSLDSSSLAMVEGGMNVALDKMSALFKLRTGGYFTSR